MKQDKDLAFLSSCKNDDLRTLCDILTHNKKGELRLSEQLTNSDAYIQFYPGQMNLMTQEISEELRKYGTNTVKTFCHRGEADSYEAIVRRVCKKLNVSTRTGDTVQQMEYQLLLTLCEQTTSKLTEEELRELADKMGIHHKSLNKQMIAYVVMMAVRRNMTMMVDLVYYLTTKVAISLLGRLGMMGMMTMGRYIGMAAGPIGWAALAGWTISDIASPAYRVMIPAVIMVASMRIRQTALLTQKV